MKHEIYKLYYEYGQLYYEINYIDGAWEFVRQILSEKKNGIEKSYNPNGQLWKEVNYIDGKKV